MKKVFIVLALLVLLSLGAIISLPIIYHDKVAEVIKDQLEESLDTELIFDTQKVGLSLISHFPDMMISLEDFGLIGTQDFSEDTLFYADEIDLDVDLLSIIRGEAISVNAVNIISPIVNIKVLEDGKANYDITKESDSNAPSAKTNFEVNVQEWNITSGRFSYTDNSLPFSLSLKGLDHQGSGDFTQDIFDINTSSEIQSVTVIYSGIPYILKKHALAEVALEMNLPEKKYTFKENLLTLNQLELGFDGYLQLLEESMKMDISFHGEELSVTGLLSMVPGVYDHALDDIDAQGKASVSGYVKGAYDDRVLPDIKANLSLENGKISHSDYPIPIENLNFISALSYPSSGEKNASLTVSKFNMLVEGEQFESRLKISDFDNYRWDFMANGKLDLEKITALIPIEETELSGVLEAHVNSNGRFSDVESKNYKALNAAGTIDLTNFSYADNTSGTIIKINKAITSIDPEVLEIEKIDGSLGKSDFSINGKFTNFLAYIMDEKEVLKGNATLNSSVLDLNEWMSEETEGSTAQDTSVMEAVVIPGNLDLSFSSSIGKIYYDNLVIDQLKGRIDIRDGAMFLDHTNFSMLDGDFELKGKYATHNDKTSNYQFDIKVNELSIPAAFETFETMQRLVPIAKNLTGNFSTDFQLSGGLTPTLEPIYEEISGVGLLEVLKAKMKKNAMLTGLSSLTNLNKGQDNEVSLQDMIMETEIKDGRIHFQPFDAMIGGKEYNISGSNGLAGDIDYKVKTVVPNNEAKAALSNALASITGSNSLSTSNFLVGLKVTGTVDKPKIGIASTELVNDKGEATTVKSAVQAGVKDKTEQARKEAKKHIEEKKKKAQEEAARKAEAAKKEAAKKAKEVENAAKKKATEKLKGLFRK